MVHHLKKYVPEFTLGLGESKICKNEFTNDDMQLKCKN